MFIRFDKTTECDGRTDGQTGRGYYSGLHYDLRAMRTRCKNSYQSKLHKHRRLLLVKPVHNADRQQFAHARTVRAFVTLRNMNKQTQRHWRRPAVCIQASRIDKYVS